MGGRTALRLPPLPGGPGSKVERNTICRPGFLFVDDDEPGALIAEVLGGRSQRGKFATPRDAFLRDSVDVVAGRDDDVEIGGHWVRFDTADRKSGSAK